MISDFSAGRTPCVVKSTNRVRWGTKQPYVIFDRPRVLCPADFSFPTFAEDAPTNA